MTSTTRSIDHYGIHWTDAGVAILEQKNSANALGLDLRSPFRVTNKRPCNHSIPLAAAGVASDIWERFLQFKKDPLVDAMLPLPKPVACHGVWYVVDKNDSLGLYIRTLSRMSSPIRPIVQPAWKPFTDEDLGTSNVQPLVVVNVTVEQSEAIRRIALQAPYLPRRLVLVGADDVPLPSVVTRIETGIRDYDINDFVIMPWETLGAITVRRHMRGEQ